MRHQILCELIEDLRNAKSLPAFTPAQLESAGYAWGNTLSPIPTEFLESREENSLFVLASRAGYISAEQVWNLWESTTGGQIALEREASADAEAEAVYEAQSEPVGKGRRAMLQYLAERGVTAAQLDALAAN